MYGSWAPCEIVFVVKERNNGIFVGRVAIDSPFSDGSAGGWDIPVAFHDLDRTGAVSVFDGGAGGMDSNEAADAGLTLDRSVVIYEADRVEHVSEGAVTVLAGDASRVRLFRLDGSGVIRMGDDAAYSDGTHDAAD